MIISKMYDVEIKSSNYNPDANTPIYIKATATDYNGNPVVGEDLIIKHNGVAVGNTITTNTNGEAAIAITCENGGTHQFSCKSSDCIIRVNPYPIGSIYMNTNDVDPSTLFGGTWSKIEDRFLLASGSSYALNTTGGEATHALTKSEMPRHNHTQEQHKHTLQIQRFSTGTGNSSGHIASSNRTSVLRDTDNQQPTINHTGGNGSTNADANGVEHNNMPPYMVVNIWKRIA